MLVDNLANTQLPRVYQGKGVVILGGDFQALGAVHSLASVGVPVILVDDEPNIARWSRCLRKAIRMPALRTPQGFVQRLTSVAVAEHAEGWMLLPNNDELVMLLARHRDELSKTFAVPVPTWSSVRKYYHKDEAYELAQAIRIPVPRIYRGLTPDEILDQRPLFPLVLKPRDKERYYPQTGKKAVRVDTAEDLRDQHRAMAAIIDPNEIIVQEFLPGGGRNLYSYAAFYDGHSIVAGMAANRSRQHPREFGHATTYAVSVDVPELREMSERLFREIGFYGIAEVEFMRDEREGVYKFIEINGRIWGWHTLARAAGVNLPYMLFRHMMGQKVEQTVARSGVKWVRLITDIPTSIQDILAGHMTMKEYLCSMRGPKELAAFSRRDPLPFFMEFLFIPYLWWKRGF